MIGLLCAVAVLNSLTLRERVAQLVVVPFYGKVPNSASQEYRRYSRCTERTRCDTS